MVCIAAFIILSVMSLFVGIVSIFYKPIGKKYWKIFKKSWGCVGKKLTLQKCETGFKEDIKNTILAKVIVKKPKWVKPISVGVEVVAVLIVAVTVWSLATAVKSGLALYVYGTCNVSEPAACTLSASESCTIDTEKSEGFLGSIKDWFTEFGDVFMALPARVKHWDAVEYLPENASYYNKYDESKKVALDILDPGCLVCKNSYANQLASGFFDEYNVALMLYPIKSVDDGYKFKNSYLTVSYIEAAKAYMLSGQERPTEWILIGRLFTEYDEKGRQYQDAFNSSYSAEEAGQVLQGWLKDIGFDKAQVAEIVEKSASEEVRARIEENMQTVENRVKTKKIPTIIYDGKRHAGLFKID